MKVLVRHFFYGLFDFGVLSEAGSDAFQRVLIGIIAVMLTFGLLLARVLLSAITHQEDVSLTPAPYRAAFEAFVIGFPMLIVAFAAVLVSHSLFPDETDFRVLLTLPVSRRVVFVSKLAALSLFVGIFIVAAHIAMLPLFLIISSGGKVHDSFLPRVAAHLIASLSASTLVVLAVAGINGALLLLVPRTHLQAASTAVKSALLCALVLSIPLVARLPATAPLLAAGSRSLYLVPPVWFLAVDELLLGHASPYFARLAAIAAMTFAAAALTASGSYAILYRRFDRVMMRPPDATRRSALWGAPRFAWRQSRANLSAIATFTRLTLARSPLHQGVFVAIAACGAGLLLNSLFGVKALPRLHRTYEDELASSLIWAPFALVFITTIAVRAALVLPIEPRASWVFRITEHGEARVDQIEAVVRSMIRFGVVLPVLILLPLEWMMFGARALAVLGVAFAAGVALVEVEMSEWRRLPFTCSYIPGKRFVGLTMLIGFASFVAFTSVGSGLALAARWRPTNALIVLPILGAIVWERRRRRIRLTRHTALMFEDALPTEVEPLQLSMY
jgi:ABC-type transport system involved in multi-copper enzyme maturation permease subunit